jgi:hypothetical protein
MKTPTRTALCALFALPLTACDPQTDGAYQGEPLIALTGTVQSENLEPSAGVELVVAYFVAPTDPTDSYCIFDAKTAIDAGTMPDLACRFQNLAPERVDVSGEFPSSFQFDLLHPPPAAALFSDDQGTPGAIAQIFAVRKGSADDGELLLGDLVGYSSYGLIYVGKDIAAGNVCRQAQNGAITCAAEPAKAGFHVFKGVCGGQTVPSDAICSVLADGEPLTVELSDILTIVNQSVRTFPAM